MVDCIYPVHNRLDYTRQSFPRLLHECIVSKAKLFIYHDTTQRKQNETTETSSFLKNELKETGYENYVYYEAEIGNSTFCINKTLNRGSSKFLYKVDNDIIIPVGTFKFMIDNIPADVGFMMMEEHKNYPYINKDVKISYANHIGGVGLFRREAFGDLRIQSNNRFFGFTDFQVKNSWKCAKINSYNTNMDMVPWLNKSYKYEKIGWGRNLCKAQSMYYPESMV